MNAQRIELDMNFFTNPFNKFVAGWGEITTKSNDTHLGDDHFKNSR